MKIALALVFIGLAVSVRAQGPNVETIVCIRHGEKPREGLGQLSCHGLNRALALPNVLLQKYGQPQFIFAPNTTQKVDGHTGYNYIRPLMTIEPTAIRCGLPVNTEFSFKDTAGLEKEVQKPAYQNAVIFIAWEHSLLDKFAKQLLKDKGANPAQVPEWPSKDFDTIFLIKIIHSGANESATFAIDHEGLNDLSDNCP